MFIAMLDYIFYPGVIKIERFQPTNDMFHDDVHLNYRNGLPVIVKHLKIALNMSIPRSGQQQHRRPRDNNTYQVYAIVCPIYSVIIDV
jgi:hypothetical protein